MEKNTEFLVQFISSLSMLSMFTYVPYWASQLGFSLLQISLISVFYGIFIFGTNLLIGRLSDFIGVRKPFIILGLVITSVSIFTLSFHSNFIEFSIFRIFTAIGYGIYIPTLTALVTDKNMKLGKFSGYGTAAWAVGVVISGIVGTFWIPGIFIFSALFVLGSAIIAFVIKEQKSDTKKYEFSTVEVFWQRKRIFTSFIIRHSLASAVWVLWPLYLASLGANELAVAFIQVLNPVTSSIIMNKFTDTLDSKLMFNMGLIFTGVTFFAYVLVNNWVLIFPAQIILGFSWAFIYVGTLRYAIESTDFDKSTISGWINSIQSISVIVGSVFSFIIIYLGGSIVDLIIFAMIGSFLTFVFNYIIDFRLQSTKIIPPQTVVKKSL